MQCIIKHHPLSRISVPLSGTFITNQPSQRIIKIFNVKTKTNFCVVRHNSLFCMISGRRLLTKRSRSIKLSSNRSSTYLGHTFFSEMNGLCQVHATRKKNTDCILIINPQNALPGTPCTLPGRGGNLGQSFFLILKISLGRSSFNLFFLSFCTYRPLG